MKNERKFVKAKCDKCDSFLGEVPEGSLSYCRQCDKWLKAERGNGKNGEPD